VIQISVFEGVLQKWCEAHSFFDTFQGETPDDEEDVQQGSNASIVLQLQT